jgi:hypothetical protein
MSSDMPEPAEAADSAAPPQAERARQIEAMSATERRDRMTAEGYTIGY